MTDDLGLLAHCGLACGWVGDFTRRFLASRCRGRMRRRTPGVRNAYHRAVSDPSVTPRPAICLNMIVRNEAHIVAEVLDTVAPHITYWVIVDTGSDDGTQNLIRRHMGTLGIPGEL